MTERDYKKNRVFRDEFPKGYYKGQRADGYPLTFDMKKNLDIVKESVLNGTDDFFTVNDGLVSTGKSTVSFQLMKYLDNSFNLSRVFFSAEELSEAIRNIPYGQSRGKGFVLDEAIELNSRSAMSEWNKKILVLLSQCRSKGLFIMFNIPSIMDLDKSLAIHRCSMLVHNYSPSFGVKGYYKVYFNKEIKKLYIMGKKFYDYSKPRPNFYGRFSACFIFNEREYEDIKQKKLFSNLKKTSLKGSYVERNLFIKHLRSQGMQYKAIAEIGNMDVSNIGKIIRGERGQEDSTLYNRSEIK